MYCSYCMRLIENSKTRHRVSCTYNTEKTDSPFEIRTHDTSYIVYDGATELFGVQVLNIYVYIFIYHEIS